MKKLKIICRIAIFMLVTAMLLPCAVGCSDEMDKENEKTAEHASQKYGYNYRVDVKKYSEMFTKYDKSELTVVNKQNTVSDDFTPGTLSVLPVELTNVGKEVKLEKVAAVAAEAMIREMRECGYTGISVTSGYRSFAYQNTLFEMYKDKEREKHPDWSDDRIEAEVLTYSAKPGTSEHQTGLCMDLYCDRMTDLVNYGYETPAEGDIGFAESGEYRWLCENAKYFGFILRFPKDKTDVTGYNYESWHFRYVGVDNAIAIWDQNITLEQYVK